MTRTTLCAITCLALSLSSGLSGAAPSRTFAAPCIIQSPDVRLQVETENGNSQFQIGEIVPLKLSFTSGAPKKYQISMATYDRSGRMGYEEFQVQPSGGWSDPLRAYFAYGGFIGGGLRSFRFLSQQPTVMYLDLNEWVRFDHPGKYSLRVVSRRVGELPNDKTYPDKSTELVSNELQLTIVSARKAWQEGTLRKATATLDGGSSPGNKATFTTGPLKDSQTALKVLRYLGTAEAARELTRRLRGDDSNTDLQCMFGLVGSPYRDAAVSEMQRLLADADHPVSSTFLHAFTVLMRNPDQSPEALGQEDKRNSEIIRSELLNAVSRKRGKALALTLNTVLAWSYEEGKPKPVSGQLAAQLAAVFDQLPVEKQKDILESRWELIKSPDFLPILQKYARQYREFPVPNEVNASNSLHLTGAALRRWYELEPGEARAVIIQEIVRSNPRYSASVLGVLPEKTLPEVEHIIAEHFAAEGVSSYGAENLASLLQRYATDSVLPHILPVADKYVGRWACAIQAPILAYLLRVNSEVARSRIEKAMAARGEGYSACNHSLLVELGALQPDPMLEKIALSSLDDDDPEVAANAATFLGKYGSVASEDSLLERLIGWSEKWHGREQELRYVPGETNANLWQGALGTNLILALATAKSWLADENKLRRLQELALGSDGQQQLERMVAGWEKKPWRISYYRTGDQQHFQVLQYETDSLKSLEEKLTQFAKGSDFAWANADPATEDEKSLFREISDFLANHAMRISSPAN